MLARIRCPGVALQLTEIRATEHRSTILISILPQSLPRLCPTPLCDSPPTPKRIPQITTPTTTSLDSLLQSLPPGPDFLHPNRGHLDVVGDVVFAFDEECRRRGGGGFGLFEFFEAAGAVFAAVGAGGEEGGLSAFIGISFALDYLLRVGSRSYFPSSVPSLILYGTPPGDSDPISKAISETPPKEDLLRINSNRPDHRSLPPAHLLLSSLR